MPQCLLLFCNYWSFDYVNDYVSVVLKLVEYVWLVVYMSTKEGDMFAAWLFIIEYYYSKWMFFRSSVKAYEFELLFILIKHEYIVRVVLWLLGFLLS